MAWATAGSLPEDITLPQWAAFLSCQFVLWVGKRDYYVFHWFLQLMQAQFDADVLLWHVGKEMSLSCIGWIQIIQGLLLLCRSNLKGDDMKMKCCDLVCVSWNGGAVQLLWRFQTYSNAPAHQLCSYLRCWGLSKAVCKYLRVAKRVIPFRTVDWTGSAIIWQMPLISLGQGGAEIKKRDRTYTTNTAHMRMDSQVWSFPQVPGFGPQSLQKWLLTVEAAAASMQTQCDDQCACHVRWSEWWSLCLPREFPPLLFELGTKEVPDLVPLLWHVQAILWKVLSWNVGCLIFNLHISLGNRQIKIKSCSTDGEQSHLQEATTCRDHLWHLGRVLHDACLLPSADVSERQKLSNMKNLCHTHAHYGNLYLELWDLADCGQLNLAKTMPRFNLCFMQY